MIDEDEPVIANPFDAYIALERLIYFLEDRIGELAPEEVLKHFEEYLMKHSSNPDAVRTNLM